MAVAAAFPIAPLEISGEKAIRNDTPDNQPFATLSAIITPGQT